MTLLAPRIGLVMEGGALLERKFQPFKYMLTKKTIELFKELLSRLVSASYVGKNGLLIAQVRHH